MSRAAERLGRPKRVEQFTHWDEARERRRAIAERRKKPSLTAEPLWQATTTTPLLYDNTWFTTNITTTITAACNDLSTYFTILGDNVTNAATTFTNAAYVIYDQYYTNRPGPATEEVEAQRRRVLRNERLRSIATRRGRKLLVNLLSSAQRADYAKTGTFLVAAESGRLYRLRKARTALELDPKTMETIASLCVHMTYGFIAEDSMIANLLALETDEEAWRKTANISPRKSGIPYSYSQGAFADLVAA